MQPENFRLFFVWSDECRPNRTGKESDKNQKEIKLYKNNYKSIYTKETKANKQYYWINLWKSVKIIRKSFFFSKNYNSIVKNFK